MERFSTSRRSSVSINKRGGYETVKDPRPLNDKAFRERALQDLMRYLRDVGFAESYTLQQLRAPSKKIFLDLFQFMYSQLNMAFKFGSKSDEEVIQIIKSLGYKANITKSTLYSVGNQFSWPQLLGFFDWFRRILVNENEMDMTSTNEMMVPDDQNWLLRDYFQKTYALYLQGADDFTDEREKFEKELLADYDCSEEINDLESVQKEIFQMTEEAENDCTKELEIELRQSAAEVKLLENDLSEVRSEIESLETLLQTALDYEKDLDNEMAHAQADAAACKQILKEKKLTVQKWKAMEEHSERVREEFQAIVEAVENERYEAQEVLSLQFSRKLEVLKKSVIRYNTKIADRNLLDPSLPDALPGLASHVKTGLTIANLYAKLVQQNEKEMQDFFNKIWNQLKEKKEYLERGFKKTQDKIGDCEQALYKTGLEHLKIKNSIESVDRKLMNIIKKDQTLKELYSDALNELREVEENNNSIKSDMIQIIKLLTTHNADIKEFNFSLKCKLEEHRKVKDLLEKEYALEISEIKMEKELFVLSAKDKLAEAEELGRKRSSYFVEQAHKLTTIIEEKKRLIEDNKKEFYHVLDQLAKIKEDLK